MPTLSDIASLLGVSLGGSPAANARIDGVATLAEARPSEISFIGSDAYLRDLDATRAAAVIVQRRVKLPEQIRPAVLLVDDADLALAKVLELFAPPAQKLPPGIDRDARIDPTATIGEGTSVGPFVLIGARTRIGRRCAIHGGAHVGDDVVIGDDCAIWPNVVIRERITIGNRVIIHAGAVIGTDGFGYRWDGARHAKMPQIGTVIIEDDVEIGSCACIDRAKFSATRIGRGTKIDNLVQVGHNCVVGPHCILAGQLGLAGSVVLGGGAVLGGQTAVADHLHVGEGAMVAGRSAVAFDVEPKSMVSGMPALPHRQTLREQAALRRLPELLNQVKKLEDEIAELKSRLKDS
jgi:UDP-3-O-[3-hydroxymyristoyl] glucosamine N-acyltransferase